MQQEFKKIGENIKRMRGTLKLTETDVSSVLGCTQQTINYIEAGKAHGKFFASYLAFLHRKGIDINSIFTINDV